MNKLSAYIIIILTIICDQATKYIAFANVNDYEIISLLPFINIIKAWNHGVSFGMFGQFASSNIILLILTSLISIFIFYLMYIEKNKIDRLSFALIIGGAIGNIIDRIMHGAVADFIDFHIMNYHWFTFNIADAAISIGGAIIIFRSLFSYDKKVENVK
jgi:signal peptidase II